MTATLTRAALRPLPPPRDGAFVAAHHDPRPCVTNPAQWWDTGHRLNPRALTLCQTACPLAARQDCAPKGKTAALGVIRAGVAYDERGHRVHLCRTCRMPLNKGIRPGSRDCDLCRRGRLAAHHDRILTMHDSGASWAVIGRAIGYHGDTVRKYYIRHTQAAGRDA